MTQVYVGSRITLWPRTRKGKNRLREAGTCTWEVADIRDAVLFNPEPGPWLLVQPIIGRKAAGESRWIHGKNDPDFQIKEVCK